MHHLVATMHQIGAFFLHLVIIKIGEINELKFKDKLQ
jgi:hypothetical protein